MAELDDTLLDGAVVSITAGYQSTEDVLSFIDTAGISGSWNAATGELTLTGTATIAAYEAALRTVSYQNTSDNPDTNIRTISFVVSDGELESNGQNRNLVITAVNDAPQQSAIEASALSYTENDGAVAITSSLVLAELDDTHLESATLSLIHI